jgi:periplasmic protein TonB
MRNYFSCFCLLFMIDAAGQGKTDDVTATDTTSLSLSDEIFLFPDSAAIPVGGFDPFYHYLAMNIQYPKEARKAKITGRVILEFVIEKDGSVPSQYIKVLKSPHKSLSEEAVRLMKNAPKWIPGKLKGIPVRTKKVLPISFKLG